MKTAKTAGMIAALIVPAVTAVAQESKTANQSEALRLMTQTRAYVQQENQYRYYAATDSSRQMSQDKTRSMYGADNDTGQGELKRERNRYRDGSGSGDQNKYGRSSTGGGQYGYGSASGRTAGGGGGGRR